MNKTLVLLFLITKLLFGIHTAAALFIFVIHAHTKLDLILGSLGDNRFVHTDLLNLYHGNIVVMNKLVK